MSEPAGETSSERSERRESGSKMTVGSLFSGIGGIDLGLERAGMEVRWQCEIDPFCREVSQKHWDGVEIYGDITTLPSKEPEPVDLLAGGFPCQPSSQAGYRRGTEDERWLWPYFIKTIRQIKPRWVMVENVPGLLSVNDGRAFGEILRDMAESGYCVQWDSLPAGAFGAHFRGDRVYVVASRTPSDCLRRKGNWANPLGAPWSGVEFERLVQHELSVCVPSGKGERVSDGLPRRMDRLRALGNAVVPQVAEYVGRLIVDAEAMAYV